MREHTINPIGDGEIEVRIGNKTMTFECTKDLYLRGYVAYQQGVLMQDAFPFLKASEREFLISGTTPQEWEEMYAEVPYDVMGDEVDEDEPWHCPKDEEEGQ